MSGNKDRTILKNWVDKGQCVASFIDAVLYTSLQEYQPQIGEEWSVEALNKDDNGVELDYIRLKPKGVISQTGSWEVIAKDIMAKLELRLNTTNEAPYLIHKGIGHRTISKWTLTGWKVNAIKWFDGEDYVTAYLDTLYWEHEETFQRAKSGWTWTQT
jgi:hypothetical protein